jgi:GAF domain-containing protein
MPIDSPRSISAAPRTLTEPLLYRGRLLGVVQVGREPEGGPFRDQDQYTLRLFANQAAVAIENARFFAKLNESYRRLQVLREERVRVERLRTLGQLITGIASKLADRSF